MTHSSVFAKLFVVSSAAALLLTGCAVSPEDELAMIENSGPMFGGRSGSQPFLIETTGEIGVAEVVRAAKTVEKLRAMNLEEAAIIRQVALRNFQNFRVTKVEEVEAWYANEKRKLEEGRLQSIQAAQQASQRRLVAARARVANAPLAEGVKEQEITKVEIAEKEAVQVEVTRIEEMVQEQQALLLDRKKEMLSALVDQPRPKLYAVEASDSSGPAVAVAKVDPSGQVSLLSESIFRLSGGQSVSQLIAQAERQGKDAAIEHEGQDFELVSANP